MVAYVCYTDRFAGRLADLPQHIAYLKDLGVTYIHLMPCLRPRPGQSDGGYAVMDYRQINPDLGTMDEFERSPAPSAPPACRLHRPGPEPHGQGT